jgi:hypothetical protein
MPTHDKGRPAQGPLGAGSEATAGLEDVQSGEATNAAAKGSNTPDAEPLDRDREHKGSYGGEGGKPRSSSDTREPLDPG